MAKVLNQGVKPYDYTLGPVANLLSLPMPLSQVTVRSNCYEPDELRELFFQNRYIRLKPDATVADSVSCNYTQDMQTGSE